MISVFHFQSSLNERALGAGDDHITVCRSATALFSGRLEQSLGLIESFPDDPCQVDEQPVTLSTV